MRSLGLVGVLVGMLVVTACAPASQGPASPGVSAATTHAPAPSSPTASDPAGGAERRLGDRLMRPCTLAARPALCGSLGVPENPANPTGREIELRVVLVPARSSDPMPDPLFLLAGGPGGSATESFGWSLSTFSALNEDRDFVLVDQRGTGGSNRLVFPPMPDMTGMSVASREEATKAWLEDALASMPGDPRFYTTSLAMDDIDAVRAALGYDRINLYGPSYGATAAQYYLRQHEDHVRAVVLDGGTLLDVPLFELIAANTQRALDLLFERCAADAACHAAYPALETDFATARAALAEAGTIEVDVINPATGEPAVFESAGFGSAVQTALLDPTVSSQLPALIHQAALGDWTTVARAALAASSGQRPDSDRLAMSDVIRCSEAWARYDPDEVARLGAGSVNLDDQLAIARAQAETCRYLPAGVVPANDAEPVRSAVPVLLVVGEADPQDPPSNIADASAELPNSLTVIVPGMGHTVGHLGCMPSIITAFLEAGVVDGLDASCVAGGVPLPTFRTGL
jgi:pimeloyl-ACP methyl ester carboxylesterase